MPYGNRSAGSPPLFRSFSRRCLGIQIHPRKLSLAAGRDLTNVPMPDSTSLDGIKAVIKTSLWWWSCCNVDSPRCLLASLYLAVRTQASHTLGEYLNAHNTNSPCRTNNCDGPDHVAYDEMIPMRLMFWCSDTSGVLHRHHTHW